MIGNYFTLHPDKDNLIDQEISFLVSKKFVFSWPYYRTENQASTVNHAEKEEIRQIILNALKGRYSNKQDLRVLISPDRVACFDCQMFSVIANLLMWEAYQQGLIDSRIVFLLHPGYYEIENHHRPANRAEFDRVYGDLFAPSTAVFHQYLGIYNAIRNTLPT